MRIPKAKITMNMPQVGDKLTKIMSRGNLGQAELFIPEQCEVVYVNRNKGWYEVRFLNSGIRECYKLPDFDHSILTNVFGWATPVICAETKYVYRSITDCCKDMGFKHSGDISRCITGERDSYQGYHFDTVL